MFSRLRTFFARHPVLRDAALWAIPAMLAGAVLRGLLLSYMPFAYWGSDSGSYYSFAYQLLSKGYVSLDEKRRYLYPILMAFVSLLPGSPLRWVAWLQHGLGIVSLLPLAYVVRKNFVAWRAWIIPVTFIYATMPMVVWYEHELLGETVFFACLLWALAGWVAWVSEERLRRSQRLFWVFFVPLALFLLTKPSGRFVWPGILAALVFTGVWRRLDWRRWSAIAALILVTLTVGSKKQGAWLLYVATFPLTQLETPLHAEYKAEIRDMVAPLRRDLDAYYTRDDEPFDFLEKPSRQEARPLWKALERDTKKKAGLYMDLAKEGVLAEPRLFLYLGWQRVLASANPRNFKKQRFEADYFPERLEHHYEEVRAKPRSVMHMLFALPKDEPLPPFAEFRSRLSPRPDSWAARAVLGSVSAYENVADFVRIPGGKTAAEQSIRRASPTPLGCWLVAGMALSLLPRYWRTLGVWMLIAVSYLFGVFLFSQINPRYFGPAWPVLVPLLAVPADVLARLIRSLLRNRGNGAQA